MSWLQAKKNRMALSFKKHVTRVTDPALLLEVENWMIFMTRGNEY